MFPGKRNVHPGDTTNGDARSTPLSSDWQLSIDGSRADPVHSGADLISNEVFMDSTRFRPSRLA